MYYINLCHSLYIYIYIYKHIKGTIEIEVARNKNNIYICIYFFIVPLQSIA